MSTDSSKPAASNTLPPEKASITFQTIFIGIFLYVVPPIIAGLLIVLGVSVSGMTTEQIKQWSDTASAQFIYVLLSDIVIIAMLVGIMRIVKETWRSIGVRKPAWRHIGYTIGGFLAYYAIYLAIALVAYLILPIDFNQRQEIGFSTERTASNMLFAFGALIILPPIVEEIVFRGFLYTRFRRALSLRWAAVAVSVLFAAAHLQFGSGNPLLWMAAIDTFVLSLVLVYLREKTGTIWAGAGVHALKNLLAFLILFNIVKL